MLFDLQSSRKRRTAVKIVYAFLAVLIGGGLLLFGIGGGTGGGGPLDSLFGNGGSNSSAFKSDIEDDQKKLALNPKDEATLVDLITLEAQQGNSQLDSDSSTGAPIFTADATDSYNKAADYWAQYLKLKPAKPDSSAAIVMSQAFFLLAENGSSLADARTQITNAAEAQQIVADRDSTAGPLKNLAAYLYYAGKFPEAEKAAAQALAKSDPADRKDLKTQLDQFAKQGKQFAAQIAKEKKAGAQGGTGASGTNPLSPANGGLGGGLSGAGSTGLGGG